MEKKGIRKRVSRRGNFGRILAGAALFAAYSIRKHPASAKAGFALGKRIANSLF